MSIEIKISKKYIPYKKAMLDLNKRVEEVKKGVNRELLWILEHPTTYTSGISFNEKEIIDKKIKIVKSNRGGKITLHNPGQKIVYFVIDLNKRKKDIRRLINSLEKSIIQFLKDYKIQAIGIRVSRWVAYHGCSINISNNLNQYLKIVPCGLDNKKVTSISELINVKPKKFENNLANIFIKNINNI
jgi:lipoyl(octanoyl) transferase